MAFDANSEWGKKHGLPATINFVFWFTENGGFQAVKMKSPANNFFLVHCFFGIMNLSLIAATIVDGSLRRRWGFVTLIFGALLGAHSFPASDRSKFWPIFVPDCFVMCITCYQGIKLILNYPKKDGSEEQKKAEEKLEEIHYAQAFGAWGAGFAELFTNIIPAVKHLKSTGYWKPVPDVPHPEEGTTAYDAFPQSLGYNVFLIGCLIFWIIVPMYMIAKYMADPTRRHKAAPKIDTPYGVVVFNGVVKGFFVPYLAIAVIYFIVKAKILKTNVWGAGSDGLAFISDAVTEPEL